MKKDIEWVKQEIKKERNQLNDTRYEREVDDLTTGVLLGLKKALNIFNQLDEPEVLSQEFIDKYKVDYNNWMPAVPIVHLQNLLVPKQEEVDQAYKDGYEKGKQHATEKQSEETETVAGVLVDYLIASAKLKLALSMEVEELEE